MTTLPVKITSAAVLVIALTSCSASAEFQRGLEAGYDAARSSAAQAPPVVAPTSAPTDPIGSATAKPVVDVVLPEVKGRNGRLVYAELQELGLTDVSYASRDADDKVVINPANWTAVKIEPAAGTTVRSDEPVVVTMTKQ